MTKDPDELESELLMKFSRADAGGREKVYVQHYDAQYGRRRLGGGAPTLRRRRRIEGFCAAIGRGHEAVLELGCGLGDLTFALGGQCQTTVGADVSFTALQAAGLRGRRGPAAPYPHPVVFTQMNATRLAFRDNVFDAVLSTSMIEHLYRADVEPHLREVWRVLKPGGKYLVWCPNALGHHGERDVHLSMFSYRLLMAEMRRAGFDQFRSCLFNRFGAGVNARWKVFLEDALTRLRFKYLWSHLGVRNIFLLGSKASVP
jgi:SAM-dependent methyltransferase